MPEFETDDDHTYFISRFYVHEEFAKKAEDSESVNAENGSVKPKNESVNAENSSVNPKNESVNEKIDSVKDKLTVFSDAKHPRIEKIILGILNDEYITRQEMVQKTGFPISTVDRYIAELKENEIIAREGSDKNGRWIIL